MTDTPTRFQWPPRPVAGPSADAVDGFEQSPSRRPHRGPGPETDDDLVHPDSAATLNRPILRLALELERTLVAGGGGVSLDGWRPPAPFEQCPRCAGPVGRGEVDEDGCSACRGVRLAWSRAVSLGPYDGVLKDAITACKYRADRSAGRRLGAALGARLIDLDVLGVDADGGSRDVMIVPVPTTLRRRLENHGVDHALLLARGVAGALGLPVTRLVERRHGPRLAGMNAADRARLARGQFRAGRAEIMSPPSLVVVVDDVRTTGATATAVVRIARAMFGFRSSNSSRATAGRGLSMPAFWLATAGVAVRDGRRTDPEMVRTSDVAGMSRPRSDGLGVSVEKIRAGG